jgi:SAM-dependent methyltransferase
MTSPRPDPIDESSDESFPASDPPSWEPLHSGAPDTRSARPHADPTAYDGTIPENYERFLGPMMFEPYALDLVRRLDPRPNAQVLELACGTGRVTRHLRRLLAPTGHVVATDLNGAMLATAQSVAGVGDDVDWRQADAMLLPFGDASFDAVVCQFGFMFFPDRHAAAREALRVLRPGAALVFSVWDSLDHNPLARLADSTTAGFYATDPPEFLHIPYGYYDAAALDALLVDAGYEDVVVETLPLVAESPSARDAACGFVRGTPLYTGITERGTVDVSTIVDAVADAYRREFGDGPIRAPMRAKIVSGRRGGRSPVPRPSR